MVGELEIIMKQEGELLKINFYACFVLKRGNFTYFCLSIFECYDTGNTIKRKRQTFISAFGASSNGSGCNTCK